MAKQKKGGGRVTPKGGRVTPKAGTQPTQSRRYTPPHVMAEAKPPSPTWVPAVMSVLLFSGPIIIAGNYLGLWPGSATNTYLLIGLGLILAGIIVATRWR